MARPRRYLFGPVRSRRMGRSLGIDLVPLKTCPFDCPYCQLGRTTQRTLERREYVPLAEVLAEFDAWQASGGAADYVTLAGSGEPTLHRRFGELLAELRARTRVRRALLSNGALFCLPEVRTAAAEADVVKATVSAWDQASFERVHRPHPGLRFDRFLEGLRAFRAAFRGEFWVEVFLVGGWNADPDGVAAIAQIVNGLRPDRVHLNTAVRPPAEPEIRPVSPAALAELAGLFTPAAEVPLREARGAGDVAGHAAAAGLRGAARDEAEERTLAVLHRHPATAAEVAAMLRCSPDEAAALLSDLVCRGRARAHRRDGEACYTAAE